MSTRSAFFLLAVLANVAAEGCVPAPRAYRIFLPPQTSPRSTEERLEELQALFESGNITHEEYTRKREEILLPTR
jgi:hypothetical protein